MRRSILLFFVAAMLCIPAGFVSAQGGEGQAIAVAIDQSAREDGIPTGDGNVSPIEREIGDRISQQMQNHEGVFAELDGIQDPRYAAIHGAQLWYDEYHKALEQQGQTDKLDKLDSGKAVKDVDPNNPELAKNIEQIDDYTQEQAAKGKIDPRAAAISAAVAQYGLPAKPATKKQVVETIRKGTNKVISKSKLKYKNLTKRYINQILNNLLAEDDVDSLLPTNGYWRAHPFSMTTSGKCFDNGDNGGMAPTDIEKDPGTPLCGFRNRGGLPFITYNSATHVYLPRTASIYSAGGSTNYAVKHDKGGASVGSYTVTTTVRYQVISPTQIRVLLTIEESGGCSMSADYMLELVTADESICKAAPPAPTPMPTEPPASTGTEPTPPPDNPIKVEGPYRASLPIFTDKTQCDATNTPPELSDINLRPQTENVLLIDYGAGTQLVYRNGDNSYTYDSGMQGKTRVSISLTLLDNGAASLFWSVNSKNGKMCSYSQDFELPPELRPTATGTPAAPATPASDTNPDSGSAGNATIALPAGTYTVKWMDMPGLCPTDLQSFLPTFTEVTLSFPAATTAVITFTGGDYTLTDSTGQHIYMLPDGKQGNLRYIVTLSSQAPGTAYLMWLASPEDNQNVSCTAMAELTHS